MSAGRRSIVQDDYLVVSAEAVGQIRADLAEAAGDEDCLGVHGYLMAAVWILILCMCRGYIRSYH
ncbi:MULTISPECIES: hypothetical protein [Methanohalophilus]|uniref:hypothetical protein n=1 Tax=Methanohalophilus TaxID=2175 RepID=UPI001FB282B4|nr:MULTISPECIES: hypothetical protein [Methanohalophilus]